MKKTLHFICRFTLTILCLFATFLCINMLSKKIVAGEPEYTVSPTDDISAFVVTPTTEVIEENIALTDTLDTSIDEITENTSDSFLVSSDINFSNLFASEIVSNTLYTIEHKTSYATILMCGDMLCGGHTNKVARQEDGTYNFDIVFEHVTETVQKADLAILNQEVILGGTGLGLSGYPKFNSAFELGDSEVKAGFDVICQASNHTVDQGAKGFDLCMNYWKTNHPEIGVIGVAESQEERDTIYVTEINGISIAILNYTYGTNGLPVPKDRPYMVNLLNEELIISDLQKANELADFVIVCPHWGTEYVLKQTTEQEKWAQLFADYGADLVIGTHPHVIEPVQWITGVNGNQTLVYYSLGNFNSNQARAETMLGIFATIRLVKNDSGVSIDTYGAIPLVTHYKGAEVSTYLLNEYPEEKAAINGILSHDSKFSVPYMYQIYNDVIGDLPQDVLDQK